ncbi:hypothetical protein [Fusobacterium nucleatum]|uniref:hypothetical protein n=1 Tax=Fusobacterium nucleatum TaxID=851 RepID=UPI0030CC23AE
MQEKNIIQLMFSDKTDNESNENSESNVPSNSTEEREPRKQTIPSNESVDPNLIPFKKTEK